MHLEQEAQEAHEAKEDPWHGQIGLREPRMPIFSALRLLEECCDNGHSQHTL
jgi:hypothetical protein